MFCPNCGKELPDNAKFCFECGHKIEKPVENEVADADNEKQTFPAITQHNASSMPMQNTNKKPNSILSSWWFRPITGIVGLIILCIVVGVIISPVLENSKKYEGYTLTEKSSEQPTIPPTEESTKQPTSPPTEAPTDPPTEPIPQEYNNALKKAEFYANNMCMSKQDVYDQLTSEYGENFPTDAAQYALDNLSADWNRNALKKAESYSDSMHMSKQGIYNQLVSEHGEQFTADEAQYAIDNLQVDWNENALRKAESYYYDMNMSINSVYDQLISEYGEQFTESEAQYAIDNLSN